MKYFLTLLIVLCTSIAIAQDSAPSASVVLEKTEARAKAEDKNVFIMFHASWCGWCHQMDDRMNDEAVKDIFQRNFVVEHLTVLESEKNKHLENPGAKALMDKYKGGNSGIPFWLVFDNEGNLLANSLDKNDKNIGCPATEGEVKEFISILKKTTDMNSSELETVRKIFRAGR